MSHASLIELTDVSHRADGVDGQVLLDQVSWTIEPGARWAVLGANGSGKTLLLRIVSGWLWPNAGGAIRRLGESLLDIRELRRSIGWVSTKMIADIPGSEVSLDTVVSGRFAQLGLQPVEWDCPSAEDYVTAREYLRELDAMELCDRPFGVLSQGEQQKVLLARARMARPMLIVLDEPCSGLDPGARERFLDSLATFLDRVPELAVIVVTHHLEEILPQIDRTLVLSRGRVLLESPTRVLVNHEVLGQVYGCKPQQIVEIAGRYWPIW